MAQGSLQTTRFDTPTVLDSANQNKRSSGQQLQLTLRREATSSDVWLLDTLQLKTGVCKNITQFKAENALAQALHRRLERVLDHYLEQTTDQAQIINLPDARLSIGDLSLGNLSIIVYDRKKGTQRAMITANDVSGPISNLIVHQDFRSVSRDECDEIVLQTVLGLISPCIALTELDFDVRESKSEQIKQALETLSSNREELIFYEFLLKRHISRRQQALASISA